MATGFRNPSNLSDEDKVGISFFTIGNTFAYLIIVLGVVAHKELLTGSQVAPKVKSIQPGGKPNVGLNV